MQKNLFELFVFTGSKNTGRERSRPNHLVKSSLFYLILFNLSTLIHVNTAILTKCKRKWI